MDNILNFIWEYRFVIIAVVAFILYVIFNPQDLKLRIMNAILDAKQLAKEGVLKSGLEQRDWVVSNVFMFLNNRWSFVVKILGEDRLKVIIQNLYDKALDYIDDGKFNNSLLK